MNLGLWIFLSILVVCFIVIFCITHNRWNWKKIVVRGSIGLSALALLVIGGGYWYLNAPLFPTKQYELENIKLGYSEGDVRFFYGEPKKVEEETSESYGKLSMGDSVRVFMWDKKVVDVMMLCSSYSHKIQGVGCYDSSEDIIKKFGKPSFVSIHKNEGARIISYKKYQLYFHLERNRVTALGIYDTEMKEARRFSEEKVEPVQTAQENKVSQKQRAE